MWIERDLFANSSQKAWNGLETLVLLGPRQCGKTSLLKRMSLGTPARSYVTFDDLAARQFAQRDPALFLNQYPTPLVLDEVQYVPEIFSEIKFRIDRFREDRLAGRPQANETGPIYRLTGSSLALLDRKVKESLAGRATRHWLHPLSVHELTRFNADIRIESMLFRGGWPELYIRDDLSVMSYLNDYIRSYLEKDIAAEAGITKIQEFLTVLRLAAARTGSLIQFESLANDSGVKSPTVKAWLQTLARLKIVEFLEPWHANRSLRLIKSPKFYFLDTGLATRLSGYSSIETLMLSPFAGGLFESLVFSEIIKTRDHFGLDWELHFFRSKGSSPEYPGQEIDFLITSGEKTIALDAKLALQGVRPAPLPLSFKKALPQVQEWTFVTLGGSRQRISKECQQVPIKDLQPYLMECFGPEF